MGDWTEVCRHALLVGSGLWLQSGILLSAGLGAGWIMRKRGPLFEAAIYKASLCAVLLGAFLAVLLTGHIRPLWQIASPSPQSEAPAAASPSRQSMAGVAPSSPDLAPEARIGVRTMESSVAYRPHTAGHAAHERAALGRLSWPAVYAGLAIVWFVIALAQIAWLLPGAIALARIGRMRTAGEGERVSEMLTELSSQAGFTPPRLIIHEGMGAPFVAGVVRPMIVLPAAMLTLDEPVIRAVLSHELGHVASRDSAWALLFRVVMALAWPQPLLRILYRRWRSASEHVCDARALSSGCLPAAYAECLIRLSEESQSLRAVHALALGMTPFRSLLGRRVKQILSWGGGKLTAPSRHARCALGSVAVLAGLAAIFVVPGSVRARATTRPSSTFTEHKATPPAAPARQTTRLHHGVINKGVPMNRKASRMLSTVAAITAGLAQANLPASAAPAAPPSAHSGQTAHSPAIASPDAQVQVTKTEAGEPRVSIACKNTPIREAFEKLFKALGNGYSISSKVSGNVTFQVQSVPVDAALRVILRSSDQPLKYEVVENVYYIKPRVDPSGALQETATAVPTPPPSKRQWYKIPLAHVTCTDVADQLTLDQALHADKYPSDVRIMTLKKQNAVLLNATLYEYGTLYIRVKQLDVAVN